MDVQHIPVQQLTKRMIMKWCKWILLAVILVSCSNSKQEIEHDLITLKIDWDNVIDEIDYSPMVEDDVLMIPLETTDKSLIGEVSHLIYQNDLIYIADNLSKSIFVFDLSGKLKTKIRSVGSGPGEYVELNYFTVHGKEMVVMDIAIRKLLFYDENGNFIRDKDFLDIWGEDLYCIGDKLFLPNDSRSKSGYYHLFTIDLADNDKYGMFLPFEKPKGEYGWGVNRYHSKLKDEALIWHWPYDTLYTVKGNDVYPTYRIDLGDRLLPKEYRYRKGREALHIAFRDNYVTGIQKVEQSDKYLFLLFGDSESDYISVYNKVTGELYTAKHLINSMLGKLLLQHGNTSFTIQDNKIIQCYNADYWSMFQLGDVLETQSFYSESLKKRFVDLARSDMKETNPIIFIQELKK
ncbi:6-bladed beta-propeller [uncultured Bacteroides sp.]|uniref:6-bladed beta-propeller n=1 Tax=uncultured Bacteroides sp. TaxID=162156 RepID=UPI0025E0BD29|nr:6-bladed beta-propeller [uncultured Bacteroides sp.]